MPILIAKGFDEQNRPIIWMCSVCEEAFSLDRAGANPTISELHKINDNFRIHCEKKHTGQKITGMEIPKAKEDASQAAARIVRESTKE